MIGLYSPVLCLTSVGEFRMGSTNPTRGDMRGPNHARGNPNLNPQGRRPRNPTPVQGRRHRIQAQGPTCRLLATRRSIERKIPSRQLPVTFSFELEPGVETPIAGWQYTRGVGLRLLDHQGDFIRYESDIYPKISCIHVPVIARGHFYLVLYLF